MTYRLKRAVNVAANPGRDDYQPNMMVTLDAGTPLSAIAASEKAQLAPDHFAEFDVDDDGHPILGPDGRVALNSDKTPNDWRTAEAQARDQEYADRLAAHLAGEEG